MTKAVGSPHWSFWLVGAFALVWNVLGGVNFLVQMNPDMVASMPDTHRAIINGRPTWATAGFGLSVFAGAVGGLLLLLRKSAAYYLFVLSLLGAALTMVHTIGIARSTIDFSIVEIVVMILMPLIVAALLIGYSKLVASKGWVR